MQALFSGSLVFFILIVAIILVIIVIPGVFIWNYKFKLAVEKKLQEYKKQYSEGNIPTSQANLGIKDNNSFFSPETIAFIRKRHDSFVEGKGQKDAEFWSYAEAGLGDNRYRQFAQILPDIVFECDLEGNLLFINQAAFTILGVDYDSFDKSQKSIFDFIDPRDIPKARINLDRIAQKQKNEDTEYRIYNYQKVVMHVLAYSLPVMENEKVVGIRGLLVDISHRKKNEETIRILHDIVGHVGLGINVFRLEDPNDAFSFILEIVNEASGKLMRFSHAENIGKRIKNLSPLLTQKQLHLTFLDAINKNESVEIEEFIYQPDPLIAARILSLKIFPLPQNRVVLLMEDVSDKKKTEQSLKMTRFGLEYAGDIILWVDENARFLFANDTACRKYGYSKEELLARGVTDVDSRVTMMQWYELLQILETKNSLTMESIHRTRKEEAFPVEISINKFIFDGKKYYFAFVRDISERKKNDELEQKIQVARKSAALKQQFLANMSHEIRTPMTGIMGMTSLLMRTNLSPAQQEYVRNIKISSENLLNIINDVLDLSKIEAGKMDLKPNRIVFREFVDEVKELFYHQAQNKAISFSVHTDPLIPVHLLVDDQRLKQVLNNLLSNAFKFTDEGEVSVSFGVKQKRKKELLLYCKVRDTGMGISEENQKQVFEKFTQIDTSLIRPFEGTGLGLAICRELTQLMGGEISVESEPGEGSVFTFTFVAQLDQSDEEVATDLPGREFKDLKLNVLHVEDKLLNQKVVGFILFNAGCNVDFVKNGQEAIDYYVPGKYDIILMDIQMPVMDGITAYKELKRLYGNKLCPVIGLSANALEGDAQKYMGLGLDDYIVKPFPPSVLYDKLNKWAGKLNSQSSD